jgi:hypothetical protein
MTKKQQRDAWTYGLVGFGVAALIAMPAIGAIMNYYMQSGAKRNAIKTGFSNLAVVGK